MKEDLAIVSTALKALAESKFERRIESKGYFEDIYAVFQRMKAGQVFSPSMVEEVSILPQYFSQMTAIIDFLHTP